MKKSTELSDPESCLNKARAEELLFVLLERDPAAPATIHFWIEERLRLNLNSRTDPKLIAAHQIATEMRKERDLKQRLNDALEEYKTTPAYFRQRKEFERISLSDLATDLAPLLLKRL